MNFKDAEGKIKWDSIYIVFISIYSILFIVDYLFNIINGTNASYYVGTIIGTLLIFYLFITFIKNKNTKGLNVLFILRILGLILLIYYTLSNINNAIFLIIQVVDLFFLYSAIKYIKNN